MYQGNPYSQSVLYGMPPTNLLYAHLLSQAAHFPHSIWPPVYYRQSWVGPNKFVYSGGLFPIGGRNKKGKIWGHNW
jgi:hypothetical protein